MELPWPGRSGEFFYAQNADHALVIRLAHTKRNYSFTLLVVAFDPKQGGNQTVEPTEH
jgi:hypothetical protein